MHRPAVAVLPLAAALVACGSAPPERSAQRDLPVGVRNAAGTELYSARVDTRADRTRVAAVDTKSGKVRRATTLVGRWVIPALVGNDRAASLSGDGSTVALARLGTSSFALLNTRFAAGPRTFTLSGHWTFDALSPDGQTVYLLQHGAPGHYRVRAYDATAGRLRPGVIVEKGETEEDMTGTPLAREIGDGGSPVYTLYRRGPRRAFVHALNTREGVADCIDLPSGSGWRLVWSPGRQRLFAVDRVSGRRVNVAAA